MAVSTRTELGRKIKAFVTQQLAGLVDRRRVTGYGDDGLVETMSLDPEDLGDPVPLAQLRHVRASPGDDVVTLGLGGRHLIIGALGRGGEAEGEVPTTGASGGQQIIPIFGSHRSPQRGTVIDGWYSSFQVDLELPPGTWELHVAMRTNLRRSVNSGRLGYAIQFGNEDRYGTTMGREEFGATIRDFREYQNVTRTIVHTTRGGQVLPVYALFSQWDTAGEVFISMTSLTGMAIRVE